MIRNIIVGMGFVVLLVGALGISSSSLADSDSGLVAYWGFEEGSGDTAHDYSGNDNHGTIHGATWTTGVYGSALDFDGEDDYVNVGQFTQFGDTQPFTLCAWIYRITIGGSEPYILNNMYSSWSGVGLLSSGGYSGVIVGGINGTHNGATVYEYKNINDGQWHFLVGTYDSDKLCLYRDGNFIDCRDDFSDYTSSSWNMNIGRMEHLNRYHFDGMIDEVRIYDRALSEAEIESLYVNQKRNQPLIESITDIPNDQGLQVTVSWNRSRYDAPGDTIAITGYSLWRRIDNSPPALQVPEADVPPRLAYPPGDWHYVLTVPARGEEVYNCVAPTLCDSTVADSICWSVFFVSAMTEDPLVYFDSGPDSGYAKDNLAPAVPEGLRAFVGDASTMLRWRPNSEEDLAYYAIYRGSCPDFVPNTPFDYTTDTTYVDQAVGYCYKVSAFDFAGNESPLTGPVSVGENGAHLELPQAFSLSQNYPNPFNPITEIKYALPEDCQVTLEVHNLLGRKVATLVSEPQKAGYISVHWDSRSQSGNEVASGLYFYRLQAGAFVETRRMILLR